MLIAGCDGDPSRGSVTGLVTIDGRPVSEGRITFYPTAGTSGPVAGSSIEEGKYRIERKRGAAVGMNRVEIHAMHKTGEPQPLAPREQRKRPLTSEDMYRSWGVRPLEFESEVPLEIEIKAGQNVFNFPLRSLQSN